MREPMDTIRRVNSGQPMSLEELQVARATLDRFARKGKTDVVEARRRVGAMLAELEPAGAVASPGTSAGMSAGGQSKVAKEPAKSGGNPVVGFVFLLLIVGSVVYACSRGGGSSSDSGGGRNEGMAKVMCEKFIKDQLKAPSTADFSSIFDTTISGSGDDYTVVGTVDAENSFGALLRSNYTCEVHDDGDDKWSLVSLTGIN